MVRLLKKWGKKQRLESMKEKDGFALEREMLFDASTRNSKEYLLGFNLYRWAFSSYVDDVFWLSSETTSVTIGNFHNRYTGDDTGRSVTFFLMQDSNFSFEKGHFIDYRGFGANWFQKSPTWIGLLSKGTFEILKRNRWEIESNGKDLLVYRINYEIRLSDMDAMIEELEAIMPDLRGASKGAG